MDITEVTMIHHVAIVLLVLWFLHSFNYCHPISYFMSLVYLFLVHERYVMRLKKKLQFEERKQANQRKVLCDSESVRWLNYAVQKMWPICMEHISSQKILLPIIPWFLDKYKPWTAKKAVVQHLYLGRNPPMFTEMRVLRESNDDDHLVMELGMNFLTADDMSAILAVQLRKRLGFGMWTKMHMTGLHIEGKVLIGVKFLRHWPFLGRVRLCFVEPPYLQMTVKPLFNHGLDVTELPGIAGWLDNFLSIAFEQTLVEPNMLVVDMEKFVSPKSESWFSVDAKEPVAFAKVEVIEASDVKQADLNGFSDPYVKGHLGPYRFRTKTQKKTLSPKWQEEFKIPICSWELPNVLAIEVCDKDHFVDDTLGICSVNLSDLRDGQRHNMWLPLRNVKTGRLRLAITVLEDNTRVPVAQGDEDEDSEEENEEEEEGSPGEEATNHGEKRDAYASGRVNKGSFSSVPSVKSSPKVADVFEPINIEGQRETGIWVQQPGSEVSQTWEPRKGKSRRVENRIQGESNSSSGDEESSEAGGKNRVSSVRRGLQKIGSIFHRSPKGGNDHDSENSGNLEGDYMSPRPNLRAVNTKDNIGVKFVVEDNLSAASGSSPESPTGKGQHVKGMAKSILKHAGKSARTIKHVLSRKGSKKGENASERDIYAESDSSDEEPSLTPHVETIPVASNPISSPSSDEQVVHVQARSSDLEAHEADSLLAREADSLETGDGNSDDDDRAKGSDRYVDKVVLESPKHETSEVKGTGFA